MKRVTMLLLFATAIALYLGGGALAFNSPLSPVSGDEDDNVPGATFVPAVFPDDPIPDSEESPTKEGRTATPAPPTPTPMPTVTPCVVCYEPVEIPATATPHPAPTIGPFVPISPIFPIFHSPIATPVSLMCVAPGSYGQILCYEVW